MDIDRSGFKNVSQSCSDMTGDNPLTREGILWSESFWSA